MTPDQFVASLPGDPRKAIEQLDGWLLGQRADNAWSPQDVQRMTTLKRQYMRQVRG